MLFDKNINRDLLASEAVIFMLPISVKMFALSEFSI